MRQQNVRLRKSTPQLVSAMVAERLKQFAKIQSKYEAHAKLVRIHTRGFLAVLLRTSESLLQVEGESESWKSERERKGKRAKTHKIEM